MTAFDVVTARLTERTGGTGRNGTWPCPAHDDRNPSLSVSQGNEGVVLYCHAGCTTEDVVAALGLTMADLFDTPKSNASDIVATYDYTDENGTLLFQVVRFTGKKFRQRRPDGQGGWIWKLGDTRRVLYRLPKVIKGVADGATIFIVEGEKDADRLAAGGYVATCNPHGAGKWRSGYNATLEGADVVIVADRDDTGHAHARDVAWNLDGVAALVRVVEAAEGKDVSDHLAAGRSVEELVIADVSGWPQPTPLGVSTGLPSFPVDALPDWVRDHVQAIAEFTQTPVDLPACVALAVLATAVGGRVKVQVRGPWIEPTNLFTVTALPPGSRKSAVFSAMTKPLLLAETALVEKVEPKILEVETMIKITEAELKRAREGAAKADTTRVREEKRDEAMTLGEVLAQLVEEEPPRPRLVADDITPEACASLLAEQDGRLGVLSAEGGIFSILAGRYSQGIPSLDIFLKGHAGDMLRVDRKGRPPEIINSPALSLGLTVQPDVLKAIANLPGFRGRGLLARILYSLPENTVGWRKVGMSPPVDEVGNRFEVFVCDLANVFYDWKDPAAVTLGPGAAALLLDEERALEPRLRPDEDLGHVADWASKLIGAMARIAGLLHVAEHQGSVSEPISETTMARPSGSAATSPSTPWERSTRWAPTPPSRMRVTSSGGLSGLAWPSSPDATPIGAADGSGR